MVTLNFCFFNIDGVIICGDTLTLEQLRVWETRGTVVGGEVREVDPANVPWPETAFGNDADTEDPDAAAERVNVEPDGSDLDQSELRTWLD